MIGNVWATCDSKQFTAKNTSTILSDTATTPSGHINYLLKHINYLLKYINYPVRHINFISNPSAIPANKKHTSCCPKCLNYPLKPYLHIHCTCDFVLPSGSHGHLSEKELEEAKERIEGEKLETFGCSNTRWEKKRLGRDSSLLRHANWWLDNLKTDWGMWKRWGNVLKQQDEVQFWMRGVRWSYGL